MTALLVACAVCDDAAGGGVQLDVVSSTRRRGGSELVMDCGVCWVPCLDGGSHRRCSLTKENEDATR